MYFLSKEIIRNKYHKFYCKFENCVTKNLNEIETTPFIINSFTKDKLISDDSKSKEIIKPFIFGDDVRKYEINFCSYVMSNKMNFL